MKKSRFVALTLALASLGLILVVGCQKTQAPAKEATNAPAATAPTAAASSQPAQAEANLPPEHKAIADAIQDYIRTVRHVDTSKMTMGLSDYKIEADKATVTVSYGLQGSSMPAMVYTYELAKKDGAWAVTASRPKGGEGHTGAMGSGAGMPPGHPGMPGMESGHGGTNELPAGHPPISGGSTAQEKTTKK
jgi:hypothetical protein